MPVGIAPAFVDPVDLSGRAGEPADLAVTGGVGKGSVHPRSEEALDPASGGGVGGGPDIGADPAGGAVAAEQVEELVFGEVRELVEPDQRQLGPLPVVHGGVMLQVRELAGRAAGEAPAQLALVGLRAHERVDLRRLRPEAARRSDLRDAAAKEHEVEVRIVHMPQRLQQERVCLPAPGRAAVHHDVGGRGQEIRLWSWLWLHE